MRTRNSAAGDVVPALPVEIWQLILSTSQDELSAISTYSPKRPKTPKWNSLSEFLSLRLVSKLFNNIVSEIAFYKVELRADICNFASVQNITTRQREFVHQYACFISLGDDSVEWDEDEVLKQYFHRIVQNPFNKPDHKPISKFKPKYPDEISILFENQMQLQSSGAIQAFHAQDLANLPNLEEISVFFDSYLDETSRTLQVPPCTWLPIIFRSTIEAMSRRAEKPDFKPVRKFSFDCLTEACFFMSRSEIQMIPRAFENLTSITLEMYVLARNEYESPGWFEPLALILASAKNLEVLDLHCMTERDGLFDTRSNGAHLIQPTFLPTKQRAELWPKLKSLMLSGFDFRVKTIQLFLSRVVSTLTTLSFEDCGLRSDLSNPALADFNWHTLVKQLRTDMEAAQVSKIESVSLANLHSGQDGHEHMSNKELREWEEWLMDTRTAEPVHRTDKVVPEWCILCQNLYGDAEIESDSEDDSFMDDDDDDDDDDMDEESEAGEDNEWEDMDEDE